MSTLEIVTRCYKRPVMLAANQASLAALTDGDWTQTLLVDHVGIGVAAANAALAGFEPTGDYVWVLDDDDLCIYPELVYDIKMLQSGSAPDAIFVRFNHGWLGVLPMPAFWRARPECGRIGGSGVIVRRDLWMRCRDAWRTERYESDCDYLQAVYANATNIHWHDIIAGRVQRISRGAAE